METLIPTKTNLGQGGLKANLIDLKLSDDEIEQKLRATLHKQPVVEQKDDFDLDNEIHEHPCCHFACRTNVHCETMDQLVKSFSWALQEHNVCTGSLLVFHVSGQEIPVILGVSLKNPYSMFW